MLGIRQLVDACSGRLFKPEEVSVTGYSLDSRTIQSGEVFFAIPGDRQDGHDYLGEAFDKGAAGAVVSKKVNQPSFRNLVVVEDTIQALLQAARRYRQDFDVPIIGVTGSWGKTTTKELLASIFTQLGMIHYSPGNYNTQYGLPLALLNMPSDTDYGVFELGLQYPGDISILSAVLQPTQSILTGLGYVHLENFSSREALAREKCSIVDGMPSGGRIVVNQDCPELIRNLPQTSYELVTFGSGSVQSADYSLVSWQLSGVEGTKFRLMGPANKEMNAYTPLLGKANIYNVLAATALASSENIEDRFITRGINISPLNQRLEPKHFNKGIVIDDTYNANPEAVKAALTILSELSCGGQKVVALGDMLELGEEEAQLHRELAGDIIASGLDQFFAYGNMTGELKQELLEDSDFQGETYRYDNRQDLVTELAANLTGSDNIVLIKGSRAMKLENVVNELLQDEH